MGTICQGCLPYFQSKNADSQNNPTQASITNRNLVTNGAIRNVTDQMPKSINRLPDTEEDENINKLRERNNQSEKPIVDYKANSINDLSPLQPPNSSRYLKDPTAEVETTNKTHVVRNMLQDMMSVGVKGIRKRGKSYGGATTNTNYQKKYDKEQQATHNISQHSNRQPKQVSNISQQSDDSNKLADFIGGRNDNDQSVAQSDNASPMPPKMDKLKNEQTKIPKRMKKEIHRNVSPVYNIIEDAQIDSSRRLYTERTIQKKSSQDNSPSVPDNSQTLTAAGTKIAFTTPTTTVHTHLPSSILSQQLAMKDTIVRDQKPRTCLQKEPAAGIVRTNSKDSSNSNNDDRRDISETSSGLRGSQFRILGRGSTILKSTLDKTHSNISALDYYPLIHGLAYVKRTKNALKVTLPDKQVELNCLPNSIPETLFITQGIPLAEMHTITPTHIFTRAASPYFCRMWLTCRNCQTATYYTFTKAHIRLGGIRCENCTKQGLWSLTDVQCRNATLWASTTKVSDHQRYQEAPKLFRAIGCIVCLKFASDYNQLQCMCLVCRECQREIGNMYECPMCEFQFN